MGWKVALISAPLAGTLGTGALALVGPRAGLAPLTTLELWLLVTFTLGVLALLFGLSLAVGGRLVGLAGRVRRGETPESAMVEPDSRGEEWRSLLRLATVLFLLYTSTWIVAG